MKHRAQMSLFLQAMKRFASRDGILLIEREASMSFLSQRGMTMSDLMGIVLSLTPSDCFDGPEPDRDPRYAEHWTVAEFAPIFNGERLYLKMSIRMDVQRCKCLSIKAWIEEETDQDE